MGHDFILTTPTSSPSVKGEESKGLREQSDTPKATQLVSGGSIQMLSTERFYQPSLGQWQDVTSSHQRAVLTPRDHEQERPEAATGSTHLAILTCKTSMIFR